MRMFLLAGSRNKASSTTHLQDLKKSMAANL